MEYDLKLVISKPSIYFCLQPAWPELGTDQPWFVVFFSLFCFKEVFIAKNCLSYSVLKQKTINESEFIGLRYPPKHAKIGWFGCLSHVSWNISAAGIDLVFGLEVKRWRELCSLADHQREYSATHFIIYSLQTDNWLVSSSSITDYWPSTNP